MRIAVALSLIIFGAVSTEAQPTSVYTDLGDGKCKVLELTDEEGGSYKGVCRGVGGYKLQVIEGDLRQTITVVDPGRKEHPLEFWNLTGGFSAVGEKAEWRVHKRKPIAVIVRLNVSEDPENADKRTSYLVVAKITRDEICVTNVLKPSRSQNVLARSAADRSAGAPCIKRDSP